MSLSQFVTTHTTAQNLSQHNINIVLFFFRRWLWLWLLAAIVVGTTTTTTRTTVCLPAWPVSRRLTLLQLCRLRYLFVLRYKVRSAILIWVCLFVFIGLLYLFTTRFTIFHAHLRLQQDWNKCVSSFFNLYFL